MAAGTQRFDYAHTYETQPTPDAPLPQPVLPSQPGVWVLSDVHVGLSFVGPGARLFVWSWSSDVSQSPPGPRFDYVVTAAAVSTGNPAPAPVLPPDGLWTLQFARQLSQGPSVWFFWVWARS